MSKSRKELESSIAKLSLSPGTKKSTSKSTPKKPLPIADSWEDDANDGDDTLSSGTETDRAPTSPQSSTHHYPSAPPPTPITGPPSDPFPDSTTFSFPSSNSNSSSTWYPPSTSGGGGILSYDDSSRTGERSASSNATASRRPDKTDAVAKRLIAGALGVKAPKRTEEQKAYERAVREKEVKRREGAREEGRRAEEERRRAKAAAWED